MLVIAVVREPARAGAEAHAHGVVHARAGARFTATTVAPDEIVHLHDGVIDVDVSPLHAGERLRVIVGDTELEVRGTAFEVTARANQLVSVAVSHGRVEVRVAGAPPRLLAAGEVWRAADVADVTDEARSPDEQVAAVPEPSTPQVVHAPVPRAPRARPSPKPMPSVQAAAAAPPAPPAPLRSPEERGYDDAWAAMRAGEFARAARGFARVLLLAPDGVLAEDAAFWHAVALARGHDPRAPIAFRELLAAYPRSPHAGEASAMLGWLLLERRELDEAARRFRAAASDPDPAVRDSARAGLVELGR